ncbi:MAG TPA: helix-turn-helix transcriptional regulator, partial [Aestuariivirga sp.]
MSDNTGTDTTSQERNLVLQNSTEKSRELSIFLRAMRDRAVPKRVPKNTRRRRAPGLLREEVAEVAGISATWYTWLEQGRPIKPSMYALQGIARALSLTPIERQHLFFLARTDLDLLREKELPEDVRPMAT